MSNYDCVDNERANKLYEELKEMDLDEFKEFVASICISLEALASATAAAVKRLEGK